MLGDDGSEDLPAKIHALRIFQECTGSREPQHVRAIGRLMIGDNGREQDGGGGGRGGWGWGEGGRWLRVFNVEFSRQRFS